MLPIEQDNIGMNNGTSAKKQASSSMVVKKGVLED
jgi:hypothetical protein